MRQRALLLTSEQNVLPSSTNPSRPFTINTDNEHLDMLDVLPSLKSRYLQKYGFCSACPATETLCMMKEL